MSCCAGASDYDSVLTRSASSVQRPGPYESFKFLVVGDTQCGKSALVRRYIHDEYVETEPTEGVEMEIVYLSIPQLFDGTEGEADDADIIGGGGRGRDGDMDQEDGEDYVNPEERLLRGPPKKGSKSDSTDTKYNDTRDQLYSRYYLKIQVSDISGDSRYSSIMMSYSHSSDVAAIVIVFDVRNRKSFDLAINKWLRKVQDIWLGTFYSAFGGSGGVRIDDHGSISTEVFKPTVMLVGNCCDCEDSEREIHFSDANRLASELNIQYIETSAKSGQNIGRLFSSVIQDYIFRKYTKSLSSSDIRFASDKELRMLRNHRERQSAERAMEDSSGDCSSCELQPCVLL